MHIYQEDFGDTIAGFFSDEPEIGNGHLYQMDQKIYQMEDQPWSRELAQDLEKTFGTEYAKYLPLLWEREFDENLTAKVRYSYMDKVTRCVEKAFFPADRRLVSQTRCRIHRPSDRR